MNKKQIILLIIFLPILGLIIGGVGWYFLRQYGPEYTAEAYIRVLPYAEKDPMAIGTPQIDKDVQYSFRVSMATLIKVQSTLEELLKRDKVRETKWFRQLGELEDIRIRKAFKVLRKKFGANAQRDGDYVAVSMTCRDKEEAALIVNEMVDLFLALQGRTKREEILDKLSKLEERQRGVERDLVAAEQAMDNVRKVWGYIDLEEHNYPHPVIVRLNRLEREKDNLVLQIKGLEATIKNLERSEEDTKGAQAQLVVLQSKLAELEKMRPEAAARKRDFDLARIQYEQRRRIRDERERMLDSIKLQIEKLRILHDDPETPKVLFVGYAPVPLEASSPKWEIYFPGGAILGLIFGIALALLGRKAKQKQ